MNGIFKFKKWITFTILCLTMSALYPANLFGRDFTYTYKGQTIEYTVIDEDAKTVKTKEGVKRGNNYDYAGNQVSGEIELPSNPMDGTVEYTLIEIGGGSFYCCYPSISIMLPESVTTIGDYAFWGCILTSITFPESLTSIGACAFFGCSLTTSITLPESLTSIGNSAFYGCSGLTSITLPESLTSIGAWAFQGCGLTSVTLPKSLTTIGESTFQECFGLTSVTLPESLTTIGDHAFGGCTSLTSITLPESLTTIGNSAFGGCTSLSSITFPESLTTIGNSAFTSCYGLTSITFPKSLTTIGNSAFYRCKGLKVFRLESPENSFDINNIFERDEDNPRENMIIIVSDNLIDQYKSKYADKYTFTSFNIVYTGENDVFDIGLNDSKSLSLSLTDAEYINGFQTDIILPEGLSIASKSGKLDVTLGSGKASSHIVTASKVSGTNRYRIVVYSSKNETFTSGDNLLNITIESDMNLKGGDITVSNTILTLKNDFSLTLDDVTIGVPSFIGVESITLTPDRASLNLGKTLQLTAEVAPANTWIKTVEWKSADTSIATVDADGVVTPVAKGTVTITATATDGTGVSATATITVTNYPQTLSFDQESITIEEDETLQLLPVIYPANAEKTSLQWSTTDSYIGYVDGDNVLHTFHPGSIVVTAINVASGLTASIDVTVTPVLYGDADDNGVVAVNDLTTEVKYIVEQNPTPFSFKKADVNRDREVNIIDVVKTVNIVLTQPTSISSIYMAGGKNRAAVTGLQPGNVTVDDYGHAKITIDLTETADATALQGEIFLSDGLSVADITLADNQNGDHIVDYRQLDDNTTRFVVYSLSLDKLMQNASVVEIEVEGYSPNDNQYMFVHDVYAADTDSKLIKYSDMTVEFASKGTSGIDSLEADGVAYPCDVYNVVGICVKHNATKADVERLVPGAYIINGKKIIIL